MNATIPKASESGAQLIWLPMFLLVAANLLLYWCVTGFAFVYWDDRINITHNPLITDTWSWGLISKMFGAQQALRFKPLAWMLGRALYSVVGFNPVGWHACNLGLHILASALLFCVL